MHSLDVTQSSLKKIVVMLGRVRRRQYEDDRTLDQRRPAKSSRVDDYYKAIVAEAARLQFEQDDFNVAENTVLEHYLFPEQFEEVKDAIFEGLTELPSIIKGHSSWTWQLSTLTRGDELAGLPLCCLQPYRLQVPVYVTPDGRRSGLGKPLFGVLSLYRDTKVVTPGVSARFVSIPGRD